MRPPQHSRSRLRQGHPRIFLISADLDWMDYLDKKGLIKKESVAKLLGNRIVVGPANSTLAVKISKDFPLAEAIGNGRLAMADVKAVPAGKYEAALEKLGVWPAVEAKIAQAENVRAALALVASGEAPLVIVSYETDAHAEPKVKILDVFPDDTHPAIVYPVAVTTAAKSADAAYRGRREAEQKSQNRQRRVSLQRVDQRVRDRDRTIAADYAEPQRRGFAGKGQLEVEPGDDPCDEHRGGHLRAAADMSPYGLRRQRQDAERGNRRNERAEREEEPGARVTPREGEPAGGEHRVDDSEPERDVREREERHRERKCRARPLRRRRQAWRRRPRARAASAADRTAGRSRSSRR